MSKNKFLRTMLLTTVFLLVIFNLGCPNAQESADKYFSSGGLNRLRIVNDSIQPGAVIIVNKKKKAFYTQNILDYNNTKPTSLNVKETNSIMYNNEKDSTMKADIALKFLSSFLPVSVENKIKLTSDVKVAQASAKSKKINPSELDDYINSQESQNFINQMKKYMDKECKIYIAYETYQANKFKLTAKAGEDISVGAEMGKLNPILESSKPTFGWVKNSKTEIDINGDNYYTIALRTAKLSIAANGEWFFDITDYAQGGVLSATDDELKYSNSPLGAKPEDYQTIELIYGEPELDN